MVTTIVTVEVDNLAQADLAVRALGWDAEAFGDKVQICTTENISVARMLGDFWTEYADIAEGH